MSILVANNVCESINLEETVKTNEAEIAHWETTFDKDLLRQVNMKRSKLDLPSATYIDGELIMCLSSSFIYLSFLT